MLSVMCGEVTDEWGKIFEKLAKQGGLSLNNVDISMLLAQRLY